MKKVYYIPSVLLIGLLLGCATTFRPWKLSEVQTGMEREQVILLLGNPDRTGIEEGVELLYYSYSESYNQLDDLSFSETDTDLQKQIQKRKLSENRYVVKLVDGKVLDYTELLD